MTALKTRRMLRLLSLLLLAGSLSACYGPEYRDGPHDHGSGPVRGLYGGGYYGR
ncbi:MAG TPA: hypothetical protein VNZ61_15860 [Roseomonas sp.]|nr:hypothetical protein [Roseomonas sp.]